MNEFMMKFLEFWEIMIFHISKPSKCWKTWDFESFLKIQSVHKNSKIKKLEKWKLEIIQFQITFDFWVFNFKRLLSADLASSMNFQTSLTALFRQVYLWNSCWFLLKLVKVALKVFEKKIKKAQELKAEEEARLRLEASASIKERAHWGS